MRMGISEIFLFFLNKIPNSWGDNNNEAVDLIDALCDKRLERVDIKFNNGMLIQLEFEVKVLIL